MKRDDQSGNDETNTATQKHCERLYDVLLAKVYKRTYFPQQAWCVADHLLTTQAQADGEQRANEGYCY